MRTMCGRFTRNYTWAQIYAMYRLTSPPANIQPNFNVCPTDTVDVVVRGDDQRILHPMRWGLIPGWWKKPLKEMRVATFNARADTIAIKPMFKDSFQRRRCLMPATGYYEWITAPNGKKLPIYFSRADGEPITFAAIQDAWTNPETGERIRSCSMVITEANKVVSDVHDRMPVILELKDIEQWERGDVKDAAALMKPTAEDVLQKWPVSPRVNSSRTPGEDSSLVERVELPPTAVD
jgi:putative SOS response-associated peptidase YedK